MTLARRLEERLVRYAAVDTQSDSASDSVPSTGEQLVLTEMLAEELRGLGLTDVVQADYGAVFATVPATVAGGPTIGFCAHVDTAPQFAARGVRPRVLHGWDGSDIAFPDNPDLVLSPEERPYLARKVGDDIVTASGTTLLGADDKAGVAIVVTLAEELLANDAPRPALRLALTCDEEIGRGVTPELARDFACDFAYTFDGGEVGEFHFETFSADLATITVTGVSAHPGQAKGVLVNALHPAAEIVTRLNRPGATPETTEGREGFVFCAGLKGGADRATLSVLVRDFERDDLAARGDLVRQVSADVARAHPGARVDVTITPQYRNMRYWLDDDRRPVDLALAAYRAEGIEPRTDPIRGGTDGSRLTEFGVPCPNLFTGMQDVHGPLEWISVQDMAAATRVGLRIAALAAGQRD